MARPIKQHILGAVLALVLAGCGGAAVGAGTAPAGSVADAPTPIPATPSPVAAASEDFVKDVEIGDGTTMHLLCVGPTDTGRPTVVFESGLGGDAGQWSDVVHELGGATRACAYDRAGVGGSPPAAPGRTTSDQVADLRALLAAADVPPPYLLVGFSSGGWNTLVHADRHPEDVVGAVLVDARPPDFTARSLAALPPEAATEADAIRITREDATVFEVDPALNPEGIVLRDSAAEALEAVGLTDKPLIVLAASDDAAITEGFDTALADAMRTIWWEGQEGLAARSTQGRLERVDGTEHEIPFSRPDAVADAIREILGD